MGLSSYSDLKAAIASWMARGSLPTGVADEVIDMAEAEFNRIIRNKELKTSDTFTTTIGQEYATLPSGCKIVTQLQHTDSLAPRSIKKVSPEQLSYFNEGELTGRPHSWCEGNGDNLVLLAPIPDAVYTIKAHFYKNVTPLDDTNTSNWLLVDHPDLYLLVCLKKAALRFVDEKRLGLVSLELAPLMQDFLDEIEEQKAATEGSGGITIKGGIA